MRPGPVQLSVQKYPMRASARSQLDLERLQSLCRTHFDEARRDGDAVVSRYGAIEEIRTWPEGKELAVDMRMNAKVEESVARETIRRYNQFLEDATGFNAKERAKRLRKSAGAPGTAG
jgi:hypothetical protein